MALVCTQHTRRDENVAREEDEGEPRGHRRYEVKDGIPAKEERGGGPRKRRAS